jgi:hypothetical protein
MRLHTCRSSKLFAAALVCAAGLTSSSVKGEPVAVRYTEGLVHGFLVLRGENGSVIANGDLFQVARGNRVTTRLEFRFKDGSTRKETTIYSQAKQFRLLSHRSVEIGPTFPDALDMSIDGATGRVIVRYTEDGERKTATDDLTLPDDLANGLILTVLKNVRADAPPKTLSFVAATPKPRLVKLAISVAGTDGFSTGGASHKATHYVLRADIDGISGLLARLSGKQPPDSHVWVLGGAAPTFVRAEYPLYLGGPLCRVELVSPKWPR